MNRHKKEEMKQYKKAREGLTPEQVHALDLEESKNQAIEDLARTLHREKFSEEYDYMGDDTADAKARRRGTNPMSEEYIRKIAEKRENLGVSPLAENGMSQSQDTWELCLKEATQHINEV